MVKSIGSVVNEILSYKQKIHFLLSGVPRVWEKIEEKIKLAGQENKGVKKKIADWAKVSFPFYGRKEGAVYCTSPQSFIITFSYSLD